MDNYQIARRAQIGVIIPSTSTGVEYDLQKFHHIEGVTWHPSRFWIELRNWADESAATGDDASTVFERFLDIMRGEIPQSLRYVISAKVSHIMLGMSAETFWGGLEGSIRFEEGIREHIGDLGLRQLFFKLAEQRRLVIAQLGLDPILRVQKDLPVRLPHAVALHPAPLAASL